MGPKPMKLEQRTWSMCLISTTIILCLHSSWSFFHRITSSSCNDPNVRHRLQRSMRGVCRYCSRGTIIMERASGRFQKLAKPKFDPQNPNAVLGEIEVPGLEQVSLGAHVHLHPKREAAQMLKERVQAWCARENRRESETLVRDAAGGVRETTDGRRPRRWDAYEYTIMPSHNRTLDSEIMGINVGRCVNDTRINVCVDYGNLSESRDIQSRLSAFMAEISTQANAVFGFVDDVATRGDDGELGPWKKLGNVISWRKWLELDSGKAFPPSAISVFRVVQANWAVPQKIADAMSFTVSWCKERFEESMAKPDGALLRVEVFHSYMNPHVLKIVETYASGEAFTDQYHRCYEGYLDGVAKLRAAVGPTIHCYTPLAASTRPSLSARLPIGDMVPLVAIGGPREGVAPAVDVLLEALKIGVRHVVLEAGSAGIVEAVAALNAALALGLVTRRGLYVSLIVSEDLVSEGSEDGDLAAAIREVTASGSQDHASMGGAGKAIGNLLGYVDLLVLARASGRHFDDDSHLSVLWRKAQDVVAHVVSSEPAKGPMVGEGVLEATRTNVEGSTEASPRLARSLGIGGYGLDAFGRLVSHLEASEEVRPAVFMGNLRAGDGASTVKTLEYCRKHGVLAFSLEYTGGEWGDGATGAAEMAADFEHEDVTADEVLAKWILELGCGVLYRPIDPSLAWRTLPFLRYFLLPEWMTEIARRGGCPEDVWAPTLSLLRPSEGNPSDEQITAEADETIELLGMNDFEHDLEGGSDDEDLEDVLARIAGTDEDDHVDGDASHDLSEGMTGEEWSSA